MTYQTRRRVGLAGIALLIGILGAGILQNATIPLGPTPERSLLEFFFGTGVITTLVAIVFYVQEKGRQT